jgi:PfaD family protein
LSLCAKGGQAYCPSIVEGLVLAFAPAEIAAIAVRLREAVTVIRERGSGALGVALATPGAWDERADVDAVVALPAMYPEWLGDRGFLEAHGVRFPYVAGSMANGIATPRLVVAMARAGMLAFFGAAGLSADRVEAGLTAIEVELSGTDAPWGANLIHSPNEPELEERVASLYVRRHVPRVEASAYMDLTPAVVRFACSGLSLDASGHIVRRHRVIAKVSRPEVAAKFLSPAPPGILQALVARRSLTPDEARLAVHVPLADDVTVEADSAGHTDNRPLGVVLPVIQRLRDELTAKHGYRETPRVGAAGGLGSPHAVAGAFASGAAYVLTGTVNQAAIESALSDTGRRMLAAADLADVAMASAADMFEQGVRVQVLKRGTMFAVRSLRLYELYRRHASLEEMPEATRHELESKVLGTTIDAAWAETEAFWTARDPSQLGRAADDPRHRMALVFRWYLGKSSRWAIDGDRERQLDYQIWCGPAMGAFNAWTRGTFLEDPGQREVVQIARNLLEGACVITRAHQLRTYGVPVPAAAFRFEPRRLR